MPPVVRNFSHDDRVILPVARAFKEDSVDSGKALSRPKLVASHRRFEQAQAEESLANCIALFSHSVFGLPGSNHKQDTTGTHVCFCSDQHAYSSEEPTAGSCCAESQTHSKLTATDSSLTCSMQICNVQSQMQTSLHQMVPTALQCAVKHVCFCSDQCTY